MGVAPAQKCHHTPPIKEKPTSSQQCEGSCTEEEEQPPPKHLMLMADEDCRVCSII